MRSAKGNEQIKKGGRMLAQTVKVDRSGRVVLPKNIRERLKIRPGSEVIVEIKDQEVMLRLHADERVATITQRIASLRLPVGDWDQMEREIEAGRLE
jgi:AbrB family looped-hinge helix DNA binding protein